MEGYLTSRDGIKIFYKRWEAANPIGTLIISHGYSEYCGRYEAIASRLIEGGLDVYAFDCRGHGKSEGKRGHVNNFNEYINDLDAVVQQASGWKGKPFFLLGHSMGGLIACLYCLKFRMESKLSIRGLILSSPAIKLSVKAAFLERLCCKILSAVKPDFVLPSRVEPSHLAKDEKVIEKYRNDPLICRQISARLYTQMVKRGNEIMRRAGEFTLPVILVAGEEDKVVSAEAIKEFYEKIPSKKKSLKIYPGGYHELLNDFGKEEVLSDILSWAKSFLVA